MLALALAFGARGALERWVAATELPSLAPPASALVLDRNGVLLRAYTVEDGRWRLPLALGAVDPLFTRALIAYEDRRFYDHPGVDPLALLRAAGQALWNGHVVSGGSTLTMQVARLLEDGPTGRWGGKLRQIRLALALERKLSKDEILALYLQLAPYGGNLEGVRAAALAWFGKEPHRLTPSQVALLVALPQAPEARRPDREPEAARRARDRVLARLERAGLWDAETVAAARRAPLPEGRAAFPALAPHLADRLRAPGTERRLTIEAGLQARLEALAAAHMRGQPRGLSAAIVVMDHQSGEILASVGSAGYLKGGLQGFVDMTRAVRSPGSTLKPLIYGLAFEAGLAQPETLVDDKPTDFGNWVPRNFDQRYFGTVTAREALQYSLNVPAVALLEGVGPARLLARMRRAGVEAELPGAAPPGLAIALGGLGLSLNDLVTLYAAIARGGVPVAARYLIGAPEAPPPRRLMSDVAAWQVADILKGVQGPELAPGGELAYKTGTSYGYRDAWAVGFDGRHVIGVWVGRPDGASVPGILGAKTAAPLMFQAFGRLKQKPDPLPTPPPNTLILSNGELPQPLRKYRRPGDEFAGAENPPEIAFPPDGALLDLGLGRGAGAPLVLKLRGGTPPFTWIADGVPFAVATRDRQVELRPDGPGFVSVSVVDAKGLSQKARLELR